MNRIIFRLLIIIVLAFSAGPLISQKNYFNVDLGLSQTYKGFFYLYDGIIDVGAGYNHHLIDHFYGGFSFYIDYLNRSNTSARTMVYKPRVSLSYDINLGSWFAINPVIFVGYSFLNISNKEYNYTENQNGINCGGELRLVWRTENRVDLFIFGRYDYIYLTEDINFAQLEYYRRVHLSSFGIGIKLKSKQKAIQGWKMEY